MVEDLYNKIKKWINNHMTREIVKDILELGSEKFFLMLSEFEKELFDQNYNIFKYFAKKGVKK